jgi:hypothetical protein
MLTRLVRLAALLLGLFLVSTGSGPRVSAQPDLPPLPPGTRPPVFLPDEPAPSKLDELRKERLTILREIAKQVAQSYKSGTGSSDEMQDAMRRVFEAELDLCTTDKERVAVLEKAVAEAKKWEDVATKIVEAGQAPARTGLKARANRLQAEIALERLRSKGTPQPVPEEQSQVRLAEKQAAIKLAGVKVAEVQLKITQDKLPPLKARIAESRANEALAEQQLKRIEELVKQSAAPVQLLDEHRAKLEVARARRAATEATVAESEGAVLLEQARVEVARREAEEADLRVAQLKARLER